MAGGGIANDTIARSVFLLCGGPVGDRSVPLLPVWRDGDSAKMLAASFLFPTSGSERKNPMDSARTWRSERAPTNVNISGQLPIQMRIGSRRRQRPDVLELWRAREWSSAGLPPPSRSFPFFPSYEPHNRRRLSAAAVGDDLIFERRIDQVVLVVRVIKLVGIRYNRLDLHVQLSLPRGPAGFLPDDGAEKVGCQSISD
jgi:hypothetical protein